MPWQFVPQEREALDARCSMYEAKRCSMLRQELNRSHGVLCPKVLFAKFMPDLEWSDLDNELIELSPPTMPTTLAHKIPYEEKSEPIYPPASPIRVSKLPPPPPNQQHHQKLK